MTAHQSHIVSLIEDNTLMLRTIRETELAKF